MEKALENMLNETSKKVEGFQNLLTEISKKIEVGEELFSSDFIIEIKAEAEEFSDKLNKIKEDGRNLKLGIVGEIKAGKSSFLNALLFDGKDFLPKAPTPMTAALTRISYSDKPKTKVVFYSERDWQTIEDKAEKYNNKIKEEYKKYEENLKNRESKKNINISNKKSEKEFERIYRANMPTEWTACKEVYDMAKDIDVYKYLGTEKEIEQNGDDKEYENALYDYVGAKGRFTPIVKYTEIQKKNEMLKGIEVVDTPGLNDPILSRSRVTQKFLNECDAVFLLSYCGQFLGEEDINFIMSTLPNDGINEAVLIGSKFDSAILQFPERNATFKRAYLMTKMICEEQAEENISDCIKNNSRKVIENIKAALPPICISSIAYTASLKLKNNEGLSPDEELLVANMKRRFSDYENTPETLEGLSNITNVREKVFNETVDKKEKIIKGKIDSFWESRYNKFLSNLEGIGIQARENLKLLKNNDKEELENRLNVMKGKLDSVRTVVKNMFERAAINTAREVADMTNEIYKEMGNNLRFEIKTQNETKTIYSHTTGLLFWKKDHYRDVTTIHHIASIVDVEENIKRYNTRYLDIINYNFKDILKIDELKSKVKDKVIDAFDTSNRNFNEDEMLIPLDNALEKIVIQDVTMDIGKYLNMLDEELTGVISAGEIVKNDNIHILKKAQNRILNIMSEDFVEDVRKRGKEIENQLNVQAAVFIDDIVTKLEENNRKVQEQLDNKIENIKKYESFIKTVDESKKELIKAGGK
ncbi:MAG: dynamin family protein [Lachnospirales bacterium]